MDIILTATNLAKGNRTHFSRSIFVPVAFVSMLTAGGVAYSAYYNYEGQSRQTATSTKRSAATTSSKDNLDDLALRVNVLHAQAARLDKWGKQLVNRKPSVNSDFSLSWDQFIERQQRTTQTGYRNQRFSHKSYLPQRLDSQASAFQTEPSIIEVPKNLWRQYRSQTQNLPEGWPLKEGRVSSPYGLRGKRMHKGIDIAASVGTPIYAVEEGEVVRSQYVRGYGRLVEIRHSDMYSTRYAHNSKNLVEKGDYVYKNQMIALVGSSGRSTGPHVHFEVQQSGVAINPVKYLGAMDNFRLTGNIELSEYVRLSKK
jgi:murein DD-endopeptidase MepM/ murein hydrolase activator NlpD